ncbi:hypothetical protein GPL15_12155 [Clostridium sp. MCC353]|uniref:DUF5721 family protein n=1 Tax=Clostridium sp. MCC353 TaxID=2592646 RepID=UPI001C02E744|nr:DUF5721 family protein [Clostridium sp. MCC353]MBT9777255.1 hypothetical protein [Clostridium sp. MCC353]
MVALKIDEIGAFTRHLFVGETFDRFLLREAEVVTYNAFHIDGHIRMGYYSDEELEEKKIEDFSSWSVIRPICFLLIKGKKLPGSFAITLQMPPNGVEKFIGTSGLSLNPDQVNGLYVNIRYENGELYCVTGTSLNFFTLDKSLEQEWDESVKRFLKKHQIVYEES